MAGTWRPCQWLLLLVIFFLSLVTARLGDCFNDLVCAADCQKATSAGSCGVHCDPVYGRCACEVGHALLREGTCAEAESESNWSCSPTHRAWFNIAVISSPEVRAAHLFEGSVPSNSLSLIIHSSVSAALQRPVTEVAVYSAKLTPMAQEPGDYSDARGRVLHFDLNFSLCTAGDAPVLRAADFEQGFKNEAHRYAAFDLGTIRLMTFASLLEDANQSWPVLAPVTAPGTSWLQSECPGCNQQPTAQVDEQRAAAAQEKFVRDVVAVFAFYLMIGLSVVTAGVLIGLMIVKHIRRKAERENETQFVNEIFAPPLGMQDIGSAAFDVEANPFDSGQPVVACAIRAYVPDPGAIGTLALDEGDVIEVTASVSGWLFGKILGVAGQEGYFPESCVSWLGSPVTPGRIDTEPPAPVHIGSPVHGDLHREQHASPSEDVAGHVLPDEPVSVCDAHLGGNDWTPPSSPQCPAPDATEVPTEAEFVARVVAAFDPSEVEDNSAFEGQLLQLELDEVVQVQAATDGWLYGVVVGMPERAGYFPENRINWLSQPDAAPVEQEPQLQTDAASTVGLAKS